MALSNKAQSFISHFGEMSSRWGFNRTVGQILALLVVRSTPLNADEISQSLHISRGNASMGLKELQSWRLIRPERIPGDRKDYFTTAGTISQMAKTVFEERRKREIDPTLSLLREHLLEPPVDQEELHAQQQMAELHDLLEVLTQWAGHLNNMSAEQLQSLMKLGAGVGKVLEFKNKVAGKNKDV